MTSEAIEVSELSKRFGKRFAVERLSFEVPWGQVTGFLGPNGAGKSTTLRIILGLTRPTSGSAHVMGRPYADLSDPAFHVGAALEATAFHPGRTARHHLGSIAAAAGIDKSRASEVLRVVGLDEAANRRVGKFSLGMKQRLALATALLGDPDLLILDEPANGLDPAGIRWLRTFIRGYATSGRAVLVSSHQLSELSQIADRVVVINRGRLVTEATMEEITAGSSIVAVRTPRASDLQSILVSEGIAVTTARDNELTLSDVGVERVGAIAAAAGIPLHELHAQTQTLEEIFLGLTNGKEND